MRLSFLACAGNFSLSFNKLQKIGFQLTARHNVPGEYATSSAREDDG